VRTPFHRTRPVHRGANVLLNWAEIPEKMECLSLPDRACFALTLRALNVGTNVGTHYGFCRRDSQAVVVWRRGWLEAGTWMLER
jgi:hypothetical protein